MTPTKRPGFNYYYIAAVIFHIAYAMTVFQQMQEGSGWLLALFFVSRAIASGRSHSLKGYWYSVNILAIASVAMYYPQDFKTVGGK